MAVETSKERNSHSKLTIEKLNDRKIILSVAYLGGGGGHATMKPRTPLRTSEIFFWRDTLLKMRFQTYIFCSKVPSKCRKWRFRDTNFKTFTGGGMPLDHLELCRRDGLPLTKILATLLNIVAKFMKHSYLTAFQNLLDRKKNDIDKD